MGDYEGNVERFSGFAEAYDRYRFRPPAVLAEILGRCAGVPRPQLVVDLGCATGPSTRYWARHAERVVGVEPVDEMREHARAVTTEQNVEYRAGYGHETGLPDACADVVTCSQSFHWMEPATTLVEVGRVLRPGGVFAVYDYAWPALTGVAPLDAVVQATSDAIYRLEEERGLKAQTRFFGKDGHAGRMVACGEFASVRNLSLHSVEASSAERLVGGFGTLGAIQTLRRQGVTDQELGLTELREAARAHLGDDDVPIYVSYTLHIGVRTA